MYDDVPAVNAINNLNYFYTQITCLCDLLLNNKASELFKTQTYQQLEHTIISMLRLETRPEYIQILNDAIQQLKQDPIQAVISLRTIAKMNKIAPASKSQDQYPNSLHNGPTAYQPTQPVSGFCYPPPPGQTELDMYKAELKQMSIHAWKYTPEETLGLLKLIFQYLDQHQIYNTPAYNEIKDIMNAPSCLRTADGRLERLYLIDCWLEGIH